LLHYPTCATNNFPWLDVMWYIIGTPPTTAKAQLAIVWVHQLCKEGLS